MSDKSFNVNFNENLVIQIDDVLIAKDKLSIRGWLFAQIKIVQVSVMLNKLKNLTSQVKSFGIDSSDVANQYGEGASACRFAEDLSVDCESLEYITLIVTYLGGRKVMSTIYRAESAKTADIRPENQLVLGIGVSSYNRPDALDRLLRGLKLHTTTPFELIVADDGSSEETIAVLRKHNTQYITGQNRGISWNKNRALYYLNSTKKCDVTILLEDDSFPVVDGWEEEWIRGGLDHGHVNLSGHWFVNKFLSGDGTANSPVISTATSGQCVAFSRTVMERVGYFDTRFGRYGYEHVEHTERCIKAGYGGFAAGINAPGPTFLLIRGGIHVGHLTDMTYHSYIKQNQPVYDAIRNDEIHRWAWRGDEQMRVFLHEQESVVKSFGK